MKSNRRRAALTIWVFSVLLAGLSAGCGPHRLAPAGTVQTVVQVRPEAVLDHAPKAEAFAPVFIIDGAGSPHNRIGKVSARYTQEGKEELYIDPEIPVVYAGSYGFHTEKAAYRNLVYRIHFPKVPFSLIPFHLTAGSNPGILVVITLDAQDTPLLVTTVHTCGCYLAILPTSNLSPDAFPKGWAAAGGPIHVYGETLPRLLDFSNIPNPRLMIRFRADVHRVMALRVVPDSAVSSQNGFSILPAALLPISVLDAVPINGGTTSFFYGQGEMKGHVKGAQKPWESLFLSWISLDFFVGMDKAYADTGNPFYTSLKPWRRNASDMWRYAGFLKYWGWQL